MNVITFCLYGSSSKYTIGCIKNAQLREKVFKDWEMWVYYNSIPFAIIETLNSLGVKTISMNEQRGFENSLWRYQPILDNNVARFISRDADSRISERDEVAVNEWIESDKTFHIVRDHPEGHSWGINAGLFGAKGGSIPDFFQLWEDYLIYYKSNSRLVYDQYIDQCFLRDVIHSKTVGDLFLHDEYFKINFNGEGEGHKIKRDRLLDNFAFMGESMDENDNSFEGQRRQIIERYYS